MTINKDQVKGRTEQVVGKIKEIAGEKLGNKNLKTKGILRLIINRSKKNANKANRGRWGKHKTCM